MCLDGDDPRERVPTDKELGLFSNEVSEKSKASEKLQSDTFLAFAAQALFIIESSLEHVGVGSAPAAPRGRPPYRFA